MNLLAPLAVPLRGTHLIEASAGTGKTWTITTLLLRLLVEHDLAVDDVLVVTFTEAATAELRDRVRSRIRGALTDLRAGRPDELVRALVDATDADRVHDRLQRALRDFDEAAISTIHGFCRRMLTENAFESGVPFDTELETDVGPLLLQVATDFWAREVHDADPLLVRSLRRHGITPAQLASLAAAVVAQPDRLVLPPVWTEPDPAPAFRAAWTAARSAWQAGRDDLEALVQAAPGLNRRSYRRDRVPVWMGAIDDWLEPEGPREATIHGAAARFTASGLAAATRTGSPPLQHPILDAMERLCGAGAAMDAWLLSFRRRLADHAVEELRRRKDERNVWSFDDLLHRLADALDGRDRGRLARAIRARYRAALIDEFQDTDRVQYRIFGRIWHGTDTPLFLIGDPKQSIYRFRGADIHAYLQAAADAGDRTWTLATNWRSDPSLVRAVNALFGRLSRPFLLDRIGFDPAEARPDARDTLGTGGEPMAPMQVRFVPRDGRAGKQGRITSAWSGEGLPALVSADIARMLTDDVRVGGHRLEAGDVAVLVRTNRQAQQMQDALRAAGIPSVLYSADSVLGSFEAADLHQLLAALADPADEAHVRAAAVTDLVGLDGDQLFSLRTDDEAWQAWMQRFADWRTRWLRYGFMAMFSAVLDQQAAAGAPPTHARLLGLRDGERRMTNLLHLAELLHNAVTTEHLGPSGLLRWFEARLNGEVAPGDDAQLRLESDEHAVKLVTVHRSKGLEFPVVYCPFLWQGSQRRRLGPPAVAFHDPDDGDRPKLDLGTDRLREHTALEDAEAAAEGLRQLYVALTRARHLCLWVWGAFQGAEAAPPAWLLHRRVAEVSPAALGKRLKKLDDEDLLADLQALADGSDGSIEVTSLDDDVVVPYRPGAVSPASLTARPVTRRSFPGRRTSSFSGLVAGEHTLAPHEADGLDHADFGAPSPATSARPTDAPANLVGFPAGRRVGTCLHAIFEHVDFVEPTGHAEVIEQQLHAHGYAPSRWAPLAATAVQTTLDTPLGEDLPRLRDVDRSRRLDELPFVFPAQQPAVDARALADVLRRHGSLPSVYTDRVEALEFVPLQGFLKGFVDLVFEHQGRWWMVDYKSNRLGDRLADYAPPRLARAMADHHYYLQYHLYAVALHRLLAYRLPTYDPGTHFGGALYLFIRGMTPATDWRYGVVRDDLSPPLLEALSSLFAGGPP